jgi:hypothetical protein
MIAAGLSAACGAPPQVTLDAGTTPDGGVDAGLSDAGPSDAGGVQPTLSDIQAKVFTPSCATGACHTVAGAPLSGHLDLSSSGASYTGLVNQPAQYVGVNQLRVDPGSPNNSFLIVKLVNMWEPNGPQDGNPMPYTGMQLPQDQLSAIEQWIMNGAHDN